MFIGFNPVKSQKILIADVPCTWMLSGFKVFQQLSVCTHGDICWTDCGRCEPNVVCSSGPLTPGRGVLDCGCEGIGDTKVHVGIGLFPSDHGRLFSNQHCWKIVAVNWVTPK